MVLKATEVAPSGKINQRIKIAWFGQDKETQRTLQFFEFRGAPFYIGGGAFVEWV